MKTKDGRVQIHARISPELHKALKIRATRNNLKMWEELERMIVNGLKEGKARDRD